MSRPLLLVDSGSGGFSVLDAIRARLPDLSYSYAADYAGCPYGDLDIEQIIMRVLSLVRAAQEQRQHGLIVVACNTASTLMLEHLRDEYAIPVVGVVPAIKPACAAYPGGKVLLLATPQTAHGAYLDHLESQFANGASIDRFASTELVRLAEESLHRDQQMSAIAVAMAPVSGQRYDAVVLGCTHFPLLRSSLQQVFAGAELIDSSGGIAARVVSLGSGLLEFGADNAFYVTAQLAPPRNFLDRYALPAAQTIYLRNIGQ